MSEYIGVDLHKQYAFVTRINERGQVMEQRRVENTEADIEAYFGALPADTPVVMEACSQWIAFYERVERFLSEITLAHPLRVKAIASARIKTDKIDATILAQLLRADLIPAAYIPPREIRHLRELLRTRVSLVSLQTAIKCRVHAVLEKSGVVHSYKELFGQRALAWLQAVELAPVYRQAVESYLAVFKMIQAQIQQINAALRHQITVTPEAQLLTTIPGISVFGALLILSEIGDIHRFPSSDHLCSYAGLVPSVYWSGGKTKHGRLTKQGSKYLRWMLVEAAIHGARKDQRLAALHKRVAAKHGKQSARIAVARQLLRVIYAMLKRNEGFRLTPIESSSASGERRGVLPPSATQSVRRREV